LIDAVFFVGKPYLSFRILNATVIVKTIVETIEKKPVNIKFTGFFVESRDFIRTANSHRNVYW